MNAWALRVFARGVVTQKFPRFAVHAAAFLSLVFLAAGIAGAATPPIPAEERGAMEDLPDQPGIPPAADNTQDPKPFPSKRDRSGPARKFQGE